MTGPSRRSRVLERAAGYCLRSLEVVTPTALHGATPCAGWDLETVLDHLGESLSALREGACNVQIEKDPPAGAGLGRLRTDDTEPADATERAEGLVTELRLVIGTLLREWQRIPPPSSGFSISDLPLSIAIVESVAVIEIAVHGWDIFESCGMPSEIPEHLALALLPVSALVIDETLRPLLFAAPIAVAASASPSDRLVALLGRQP